MPADSPDVRWEEKKVLIIGRASPEPSLRHIETVCTGGITEGGQLLRLYPISLRYLEEEKRYRLWSWAKFEVSKNPQDKRKESYRVKEESIRVLAQVRSWSERFSLLKSAIFPDRETLELRYREDWTSMGVIEIEYLDLQQRVRQKDWEKDKPYIKQFHLYTETKPLEQLPLDMRLRFRCKNNPKCKTHVSTLIGWEYMEAFRSFRTKYGTGEEAFSQIKRALVEKFADPGRGAYALMGTHFSTAVGWSRSYISSRSPYPAGSSEFAEEPSGADLVPSKYRGFFGCSDATLASPCPRRVEALSSLSGIH